MFKTHEYLLNKFNNNEYVVIGLSGGPDSMVLLSILLDIKKVKNINIVCAHIHHNLRKESDDEKVFVENFCKDNNIIFEYMKIEDYNGEFSEEKARNIRYNFYKNIADKYNTKYILTAHHGDDLTETIMMRIVRGSTLKGYAGFNIETNIDNYIFLKPLIYYTKDEILDYCKTNNISYVIDKTNNNDDYTRNRYRHNLLPFLKREDSNVNNKFLKFSETLYEYDNYINKIVIKELNNVYNNKCLDIKKFNILDSLIQKKVLEEILKTIYNDNNINLVNESNIKTIIDLINSNKPNSYITLPNNIVVLKEYDYLSFDRNIIKNDYNLLLEKDLKLPNNKSLVFKDFEDSNGNDVCRLSSNEITFPLYVRTRKEKDKMEVKNLGTKKIKDILIDSKISMEERNKQPIVVDSRNTILWIPGVKKSKYNKEKDEKYDIIIKYI